MSQRYSKCKNNFIIRVFIEILFLPKKSTVYEDGFKSAALGRSSDQETHNIRKEKTKTYATSLPFSFYLFIKQKKITDTSASENICNF